MFINGPKKSLFRQLASGSYAKVEKDNNRFNVVAIYKPGTPAWKKVDALRAKA